MSQEHPRRPSEPIKYSDVFDVSGELASQPIAPQDAATLKAGEDVVLGQKGVPAALMESAANLNEPRGGVGHEDMTDIVRDSGGVTIVEREVDGYRTITEAIGGQVIGRYGQPVDVKMGESTSARESDTINGGEARKAAAAMTEATRHDQQK